MIAVIFAVEPAPGKLLSLCYWADEAALTAWRQMPEHRAAQRSGRNRMFAGYRLKVMSVLRDYGHADRDQAPADSRALRG